MRKKWTGKKKIEDRKRHNKPEGHMTGRGERERC